MPSRSIEPAHSSRQLMGNSLGHLPSTITPMTFRMSHRQCSQRLEALFPFFGIVKPESAEMTITFRRSLEGIEWSHLATIIHDAGLGNAQPDDLQRAFRNSALYVFAFDDDCLVGAARMISDGVYHAQLCEMVVTPTKQRQGIGRTMLDILLQDLNGLKLLVTTSFGKEEFYRKRGFRRHKTALAYNYGPWWYEDEPATAQSEPVASSTKSNESA